MQKVFFLLLLVAHFTIALADEGIFLPKVDSLLYRKLLKMGLKISQEDIYSTDGSSCLSKAVVSFNSSCSGVIVSETGLMFTNFHCCSDKILKNIPNYGSKSEYNGFWSSDQTKEIPIPDLFVKILVNLEDVSAEIILENEDVSIEENIQDLLLKKKQECELYEYVVKPIFNGNKYILYSYEVFKDIRLVGVPPSSIGRFGGEESNWEWPRHSADFAVFRIYANSYNQPSEYLETNVAYKTSSFVKICLDGYSNNDFSFVLGYPGSGSPYEVSDFISLMIKESYPLRSRLYEKKVNSIQKYLVTNGQVDESHNLLQRGLLNKIKMWNGLITGMNSLKGDELRKEYEKSLLLMIKSDSVRLILSDIQSKLYTNYADMKVYSCAYDFYREGFKFVDLFTISKQVLDILNATRNDVKILQTLKVLKRLSFLYQAYNKTIDQDFFTEMMNIYGENVPEEFQIKSFKNNKANLTLWAEQLFDDPVFSSYNNLEKAIMASPESIFEAPVFLITKEVEELYNQKIWPFLPAISNKVYELKKEYIKKLSFNYPQSISWPEADGNIRFSYGQIKGYQIDTSCYHYQTTFGGMLLKNEECKYFQVDKDQYFHDLITGLDSQLPLCFITNCHTSSGNSGSPILNSKGYLIGLNFDRNKYGTMGDMYYDENLFRNIAVDIRGVMSLINNTMEAKYLLRELKSEL